MKLDRSTPWLYSVEELVADLPKWRRDLVLIRFDEVQQISRHHSNNAAYWHRQAVDLMAVERDRSKHIEQLEKLVRR